MLRLRVLLTGPEWLGDLLAFCQNAIRVLGHEVQIVPTNHDAWPSPTDRIRRRLGRLPVVGSSIAGRGWLYQRERAVKAIEQRMDELLTTWKPDLVLSILCWGDLLPPDLVSSNHPSVRVGWLMDDPFQHDPLLANLIGRYDRVYAVDESWLAPVRLVTGRPANLLPCGADPEAHFPIVSDTIPAGLRSRMLFVGRSYVGEASGVTRAGILSQAADLGLHIYGDPGWMSAQLDPKSDVLKRCYQGRSLRTEELNLAYNGTEIAVNIHHSQFRAGTSLRTFAICGAGAFQLLDWRPGVERFLDPDAEVVTYSTPEEFREKAIRYLADPVARQRIGRAGHQRVMSEHTYAHRMARILSDSGLVAQSDVGAVRLSAVSRGAVQT